MPDSRAREIRQRWTREAPSELRLVVDLSNQHVDRVEALQPGQSALLDAQGRYRHANALLSEHPFPLGENRSKAKGKYLRTGTN
jgi:hypothetical protein